jgi:hypothetical protein
VRGLTFAWFLDVTVLRRCAVLCGFAQAWEDLFDRIKEGFKLSGRSDTISVLNDPKYLGSVIGTIKRLYATEVRPVD